MGGEVGVWAEEVCMGIRVPFHASGIVTSVAFDAVYTNQQTMSVLGIRQPYITCSFPDD